MVSFERELLIPFTPRWVIIILSTYLVVVQTRSEINLGDNDIGLLVSFLVSGSLIYLIFTTRKFIEIDLKGNTLFEFVKILGMKLGKRTTIDGIEKIYFNSTRYKSNIGGAPNNYAWSWIFPDLSGSVFKVYLKDNSGEKYFLFEERRKKILSERLVKANKVLKTQIFDNTSGEAVPFNT